MFLTPSFSSAAGDGYINVWDIRDYRNPGVSFITMVSGKDIGSSLVVQNIVLLLPNTAFIKAKIKNL